MTEQVLDIVDQFRLNVIEGGMDKKSLTSDLKGNSSSLCEEEAL